MAVSADDVVLVAMLDYFLCTAKLLNTTATIILQQAGMIAPSPPHPPKKHIIHDASLFSQAGRPRAHLASISCISIISALQMLLICKTTLGFELGDDE